MRHTIPQDFALRAVVSPTSPAWTRMATHALPASEVVPVAPAYTSDTRSAVWEGAAGTDGPGRRRSRLPLPNGRSVREFIWMLTDFASAPYVISLVRRVHERRGVLKSRLSTKIRQNSPRRDFSYKPYFGHFDTRRSRVLPPHCSRCSGGMRPGT